MAEAGGNSPCRVRQRWREGPPAPQICHAHEENTRISWLDLFRRSFHGHKPGYVVFDTGAEVYHHLKYEKDYLFVGFPAHFSERYVRHFGGVTRLLLQPELKDRTDTGLDVSLDSIHYVILKRLREKYDFAPAP